MDPCAEGVFDLRARVEAIHVFTPWWGHPLNDILNTKHAFFPDIKAIVLPS